MNELLTVSSLCKQYPDFSLSDVSFSVCRGEIMGLIGRNGAGKTTVLKSLLRLVHPNAGEISFFGLPLLTHEQEIKSRIGYVIGGTHYYDNRSIRKIVSVTKRFYPNWDDGVYQALLKRFSLSESKKPKELSEGMKVKLHLTLALSHHAQLLILDEPTSGLDPVSRAELLELFCDLRAEGVSILFSTHIISDLQKCADRITYLRRGRIVDSLPLGEFYDKYQPLASKNSHLAEGIPNNITLEDIMLALEKEVIE